MKLNPDYVRKVLLCIEKYSEYEDPYNFTHKAIRVFDMTTFDEFKSCNEQELINAFDTLIREDFILLAKPAKYYKGDLMDADIIGLTMKGYNFLNEIRNDTVWNAVKEQASKIGETSLKILADVSGKVGVALMTNPNALENLKNGILNLIGKQSDWSGKQQAWQTVAL